VKNWEKFQHYKDRAPKWIKLHRSILDDKAFMTMRPDLQALLLLLWVLASEGDGDGEVPSDCEDLAFRLRRKVTPADVTELINRGFLVSDGTEPYGSVQNRTPETETETERETEKELLRAPHARSSYPEEFETWWKSYPERPGRPKGNKRKAFVAWKRVVDPKNLDLATAAYAQSKHVSEGFRKDAERFLDGDYWREWLEVEPEPPEHEIREWMKDQYGGGEIRSYAEARRMLIDHKRQQRQEAN